MLFASRPAPVRVYLCPFIVACIFFNSQLLAIARISSQMLSLADSRQPRLSKINGPAQVRRPAEHYFAGSRTCNNIRYSKGQAFPLLIEDSILPDWLASLLLGLGRTARTGTQLTHSVPRIEK